MMCAPLVSDLVLLVLVQTIWHVLSEPTAAGEIHVDHSATQAASAIH